MGDEPWYKSPHDDYIGGFVQILEIIRLSHATYWETQQM